MLNVIIEPTLQDQLEQIAQATGQTVKEIVNEALREHFERLEEQKLEAEIQIFETMYPELKRLYPDQFVAIVEGQVVDTAADFESLFLRIQARFGDTPVLIRQVGTTSSEEWRFRSPRLEPAE
jgi:hypothetical protein